MGSGGKKKEQSGDVTIEGAPEAAEGPSYEEKLRLTFYFSSSKVNDLRSLQSASSRFVSVIAKPMASKKLAKKVYKVLFSHP